MKQKEKSQTKRKVLREIERLRLGRNEEDIAGFVDVGNRELDIAAQTQRVQNPGSGERTRRIRELQVKSKCSIPPSLTTLSLSPAI